MNKKERIDAILAGEKPDRTPFTFWYHFGNQFTSGEAYADTIIKFYEFFDLDLLKVMNDYHYPYPEGYDVVKDCEGLRKVGYFTPGDDTLVEQIKAIKKITDAVGDEVYVIDTLFDPWQQIVRHVCGEYQYGLTQACEEEMLEALDRLADFCIEYTKATVKAGAAGVFLAIQASDQLVPGGYETYKKFIKPQAIKILNAIKDISKFNILHICGQEIYTEGIEDFPVDVISFADRSDKNPSLQDIKDRTGKVVMGGMDQLKVNRATLDALNDNADIMLKECGDSQAIGAIGCSIFCENDTTVLRKMVRHIQNK
ncbi:MAG: uroporphyrinogen decarboxylase family protein [Clostridia bacterium]|nr:uroporphyrinogen decarboxylase family protein [Clostridia bacterium]